MSSKTLNLLTFLAGVAVGAASTFVGVTIHNAIECLDEDETSENEDDYFEDPDIATEE